MNTLAFFLAFAFLCPLEKTDTGAKMDIDLDGETVRIILAFGEAATFQLKGDEIYEIRIVDSDELLLLVSEFTGDRMVSAELLPVFKEFNFGTKGTSTTIQARYIELGLPTDLAPTNCCLQCGPVTVCGCKVECNGECCSTKYCTKCED